MCERGVVTAVLMPTLLAMGSGTSLRRRCGAACPGVDDGRTCCVAGGGQAPHGSLGIGAARDHQVPREQPRVALIGRRSGGPCVRAEVVVVAAGRQEQRARIVPDDFVEPERTVVEGLGRSEIPTCRCTWPIVVPGGIPVQAVPPAAAITPRTSSGAVVMNSCRFESLRHAARGRSAYTSIPRPSGSDR